MNVPSSVAELGASAYDTLQGGLSKSTSSLTTYGVQFAGNLIWVVIIPIVAFYTLRDFNLILAKSLLIVPARNRPMVQTAVAEITSIFGRYLRGLGLVSLLNGIATCILLEILHVPSAMLLGIIAGILYSVPYIGAILTVALTAAVAFVGGGAHMALVSVGASIVLHQIVFDQIITPKILGGHVGLHPILSIIALLSGNLLLGIIGMVLAVPVAACIQIAIVTVLPKLAMEVEIETPGTETHESSEDTGGGAPPADEAVEDMKTAVTLAVEKIDEQAAQEAEETES
jgi:predicted PurR-regulated permease PerM